MVSDVLIMQINAQSYITSITSYPDFSHITDAAGLLTPRRIVSAYNIPANNGANVKIGIISLAGGWSATDFNNSMTDLGLHSLITSSNITTVLVDGATSGSTDSSGGENTLDLYCVAGMAPSANIVLYVGNVGTSQNWANVFQRAIDEKCDIITHSWGTTEAYGDFLSAPLANAAAKGITVFVAAGDNGSEPFASANVQAVQYPASSANVVSVGGTNLQTSYGFGNVRLTETVEFHDGFSSTWGSAGGISSIIPLPDYQRGLTYRQYFQANSTVGPSTSLTARGIPDIAAAMNAYGLWYNGVVSGFGGTSAAAPIMAGMFARFMSMNGGRRPVPGAIHKILYSNLNSYYDITTGNNATVTYLNGYAASSNWDPVTGLGVPWGNLVYPMVTSGGTTIKTVANTWSYVSNVKVKTAANTWSNVKSIYTKTINGWQQTY